MILVDTSIWIEFFKKKSQTIIPIDLIPNLAVCPPVVQEVLQGIKDDATYLRIQRSLLSFRIAGATMDISYYQEAANIYRSARRRGITIRSSVDCLIAAIALRDKFQIWHQHRDFEEISRFTELKLFQI